MAASQPKPPRMFILNQWVSFLENDTLSIENDTLSILDTHFLISTSYPRLYCLKSTVFTAAHTYIPPFMKVATSVVRALSKVKLGQNEQVDA